MSDNADTKTSGREPFPDEAVELIASHMRVVSEPCRIRLLEVLRDGPGTVQELADQLPDTTYTNVSKHLRILFQAGLVSRKHEGPAVRYSLADWSGWWVIEQIAQAVTIRLDELNERIAPVRL